MRTLKSSWIAFAAVSILAVAAAHAEIGDFDAPLPITTGDLERLMKAAGTQPQERPQVEAAFDAYVEGWQKLRDQTLRPLVARVDQLQMQQRRPMIGDSDMLAKMSPEQRSEFWSSRGQELIAVLKSTAKAEAELYADMGDACKQLAQIEAPLFAALRAGERMPGQLVAVERAAMRRTRQRLDASLRARDSSPFPGCRRCVEILSVPPQGLDADTIAKISEIQAAYERRATPLLEQIAAQTLREPFPPEHPPAVSKESVEFLQLHARAIHDIAAAMPKNAADAWLPKARARALYAMMSLGPMTSRVLVIEAIGERSNPKILNRLAQWDRERAALEDRVLAGSDIYSLGEAQTQCRELDKAALEELAQLADTPSLTGLANTFRWTELDDPEATDDAVTLSGRKKQDVEARRRTTLLAERQVTADAQPEETDKQRQDRLVRGKMLDAADVRGIHDGLAVASGRQAVWDALAEDLLADTRACTEQFKEAYEQWVRQDTVSVSTILPLRRERRAQQSRREERWFDDLTATMPELSAQSLAVERARRAWTRERAMGGSAIRGMQQEGNRWFDVDLDQAFESLRTSFPDGAPATVHQALASWREQKRLDIQTLVLFHETSLLSDESSSKKLENVPYDSTNPACIKSLEAGMNSLRSKYAICKRAAQAQEGFMQAVVSALTPEQAVAYQAAVRRQMYPEVYRPMERVDREIDLVRAGKNASPEQIAVLSSLADAFHQRYEQLAGQAIKQLDACEQLSRDRNLQQLRPDYESLGFAQAQSFAELINMDQQYDRDELASRTERRLREIGVTGSAE